MKKNIYSIFVVAIMFSLIACKKPAEETPVTPVYTEKTKADDAAARNELDKIYSDIETVYNSQEYRDASNLRTTGAILPCGKVRFNTTDFSIDYSKSGINCGTRVLSGTIEVTLLTSGTFSDPNAKLQIVYKDYKVLYYTNNQSITYNGTTYVTNGPNGGSLIGIYGTSPKTVVHKVRGQLELTFDTTGTGSADVTREWNIFRKKTYQTDGTKIGITLKVEGDTSILMDSYIPGMYPMTSEYGLSREGDKFVSELPTPFVWSNCGTDYGGPYILKDGKVEYTVDLSKSASATIGITKGIWSATAGYKFNSSTGPVYDGTCTSNGYKLNYALKKSDGTDVYTRTSFQAY